MRVLVAGCGWLGRAIAARLAVRGDRVHAVVRTEESAQRLRDEGLDATALDLAMPGAGEALPPFDAAVTAHAAAGHDEAAYRRAYVDATRAVIHAAGTARVVYVSSTGVFGRGDGSWVDETTEPDPDGATQEVLLEAERLVRGAGGIIVRCSGLYGPGRRGILDRVRSGALSFGSGDGAWMNFCHRDDAAAIVLAALDRGRAAAVYHASDAEPATRREVVAWIAGHLAIQPRASTADSSRGNRRVSSEATRRELGVTLAYPSFRTGLA
jgi:nucleoside-diphosphate-sugar epimerase